MTSYLTPSAPGASMVGGSGVGPQSSGYYLPQGLPIPLAEPRDLYAPYWQGTREGKLFVQRNPTTGVYQWPPQWIAHDTLTFDLEWIEVAAKGTLYSWTRVWHPAHPALKDRGPYLIAVIELPHAGDVRMLGNLLGDANQEVKIGAEVEAVFEHHNDVEQPFTLVQWRAL